MSCCILRLSHQETHEDSSSRCGYVTLHSNWAFNKGCEPSRQCLLLVTATNLTVASSHPAISLFKGLHGFMVLDIDTDFTDVARQYLQQRCKLQQLVSTGKELHGTHCHNSSSCCIFVAAPVEIRLQIRFLIAAAPVCNLPDSISKGLTVAVFANQVADFGMSRIHSDLQQACSQGTITHMPPELLCEGQMHRSTDVWSFGILLWEMYTGQRPWHGMSYKQLMQTIGRDKQSPQWPADAPANLAVSVQSFAVMGDLTVASRELTVPSVSPHCT